jgi:diaminopimelate decarboxylase
MPNFALNDNVFLRAAKEFQTPFHLYDEQGIRKTARALKEAFSWCPDYKEYFAVKALPNPTILRILKEEGCGMDCSSMTELMLSEAVGITGGDIMFSANAMPPEEFDYARKLNAFINLDDITHIDVLKEHGGIPECICCRYNPGGDFAIGNTIMGNPGEAKYGFTREQMTEGLKMLKELGAKSFGIHAFLSSNTTDNSYYPGLAKLLFQVAAELVSETGLTLAFVNLSGGVGIPYKPGEAETDIMAVGRGVKEAYEAVFTAAGIHNVAIKTELGRYMTGPHGWLVTTATSHKDTYRHYIGVDACAANLMRPAMYGAYHHIHVAGKRNLPEDHVYDVTGSLCENNDKFAIHRPLPKIDMGDIVVIHDTGAHGFSMGYNYNGKLRSAEILYKANDTFQLIRRAETARDYFATLDIDPAAPKLGL